MEHSDELELEQYLQKHIPISFAMGVEVEKSEPQQVILTAPFSNNINHKRTVFGGSLHAVATLSCWSLLYLNLAAIQKQQVQIVITGSEVSYLAPVTGDFKAVCSMPDQESWNKFFNILSKKGKARIKLKASICENGKLCVDYTGTFAAICIPK